ncbi:hypothetical protein [Actinomadura violacea]|uniref:Uncharacterized protein n=1 Tax=Actinomadura violacea TaxID=2819934 RepID=A0ABS3RW30_9ACTN|nr:hypothetical protein [Actinomadura violacea]MBO2460965.1 hypothetical protein [Actinomadura violacea]
MTQVQLRAVGSGTLDGSGSGTVRVGPLGHGVTWLPKVASIRMAGDPPPTAATCYVYAGVMATDAYFCDATYDVNNDSTDRVSGSELRLGQYVFAVWSGGTPGADVTLIVTGDQEVP